MAELIPSSWDRTLSAWVDPIDTIPSGKTIWMVEKADNVSPRNARLSSGTESGATMTFFTNESTLYDPDLYPVWSKSILGGYYNGKKHTPMQLSASGLYLPKINLAADYFTTMIATDIIDIKPCGINIEEGGDGFDVNGSAENPGTQYNVCQFKVNFQSVPYSVNPCFFDSDSDAPASWITIQNKGTNQRASAPLGLYFYKDFPAPGDFLFPAALGTWVSNEINYVEFTIHQVAHSILFDGSTSSQPNFSGVKIGNVNDSDFFGWPAGKLLLDSYDTEAYIDWIGNRLYDVKLNFIGNSAGWNSALFPTGSYKEIVFVLDHTKSPFDLAPFDDMITGLNQVEDC